MTIDQFWFQNEFADIMIDDTFYLDLEYKICDALENSPNEQARKFWCDGVVPLDTSDMICQFEQEPTIRKVLIYEDGTLVA